MKDERKYWLDTPRNVTKVVWGVFVICFLLELLDLFYEKHPHFNIENLFGFYGLFGFVACVGLVLTARVLRRVVMRDEDHYD